MAKTWVLVADSGCAKIYQKSENVLQEMADLVHSESRMHERDISSDLPGSYSGVGGSRHGLDSQTGIKEQEAIKFAREISQHLESARYNRQLGRLVVVAPPAFLGVLRKTLNSNVAKLIVQEVDKNLVKANTSEILDYIEAPSLV